MAERASLWSVREQGEVRTSVGPRLVFSFDQQSAPVSCHAMISDAFESYRSHATAVIAVGWGKCAWRSDVAALTIG